MQTPTPTDLALSKSRPDSILVWDRCPSVATGWLVGELYVMADSKDLIKAADYTKWRDSVQQVKNVLLNSHQLEEARRCYMRLLDGLGSCRPLQV
jgi:hypothetical protein